MLTFKELELSSDLLRGIDELGFVNPTPIQEEIIPLVLETENDIVGLAQTGTGKTAAFGLPVIERIDIKNNVVQALILAPTRELCMQITNDLESFAKYYKGLKILAVYGGTHIMTQISALRKGVHIIVATPGRMLDLINRKAADISGIGFVVLDEADEMLNMGFRDDLDSILETTPENKRTLLFSATMPKEVARIAEKYMHDPVKITIGKQNAGAENVKHIYYQVHAQDRYLALKRIADMNPAIYGLVFCRTRQETKDIADKLIKDGYNADAIHGDLSQQQRDSVMQRFRDRSLQMLVATDVAARGLDVSDITHVINFNLPDDLEVYTHRSGRTGRAGKSGISISIVNYREKSRISQIEKAINKKIEKVMVPTGTEICQKQLFNLIDRMENVEVNEEQIAPFMETVNKKLDWLGKEELIKHFVSLEFNRFLEYYKDAPDINEKPKEKRGNRDDRGDRSDRGSRNERGNRRERSDKGERRERGERGERGERKRERNKSWEKGSYTRFFINIGKKDGILPKNIIGLINDSTNNRDINIGDIDIKDSFSFFETGEQFTAKILSSLQNKKYKGTHISVEVAEEPGSKEKKGKKKKKK